MYPNNINYPSLTQAEESNTAAEVNNQEELSNIVQYIKNLKDPEKREEVSLQLSRPSIFSVERDRPTLICLFCCGIPLAPSPFCYRKSYKYTQSCHPHPILNLPAPIASVSLSDCCNASPCTSKLANNF
jgi:hypothetical protein